MTREKYESLPLATLRELAKARKMKGISTLKKGDLIEAMLAQDDKEKQEEANAQARKKRERISNSLTAGVLQTEF